MNNYREGVSYINLRISSYRGREEVVEPIKQNIIKLFDRIIRLSDRLHLIKLAKLDYKLNVAHLQS